MAINTYDESFSDTLKKIAPGLAIVVAAILVVVLAFFGIQKFLGNSNSSTNVAANEAGLVRDFNPKTGKSDANVKLIYIYDLQCPACKASSPTLNKIIEANKDKIQFIFKNFPLTIHSQAKPAAYAAQAVAAQDKDKFFQFKDQVYQQQEQLSPSMLEGIAKGLNLDMAKWNNDKNSKEIRDLVEKDLSDVTNVVMPKSDYEKSDKIESTPSFILLKDSNVVQWWGGDPGLDEIQARIDKVLN